MVSPIIVENDGPVDQDVWVAGPRGLFSKVCSRGLSSRFVLENSSLECLSFYERGNNLRNQESVGWISRKTSKTAET